ncbi:MAG: hypothetical protein ACREH6_05565, partial [Geminicoccaceae bacterium]
MGVHLVSRDDASVLDALGRAGLELRESTGDAGSPEFLVSGNTYPNKDLIKHHGGRWSRSRQGWVFSSLEPLEKLATSLPEGALAANGGLADAPATYAPERARPSRRRREHFHG